MDKWKLIDIEIRDENSLYEAFDILHDASSDLSKSVYKPDEKKWEAFFEREYFEGNEAVREDKKFLFFRHYSFPLVECIFNLYGVLDLKVEDKARIGTYTFNEIRKTKDWYELLFCEDLKIKLKFEGKPAGKLQDKKILKKRGGFWTIGRYF